MSDEELIKAHDEAAPLTMVGIDWYREELNRRAQERDTAAMHELTRWTVRLAVISTGVAILALIVAVISLWLR
jgi:hypothetical protein